MQSWRRSTGWQGMQWQSTIELSKRFLSSDSSRLLGCHVLSLQVDAKEQAEVYNIYLRKAAEIYGVTRTRQIYEKAIETLKEADSRDMCIRFSQICFGKKFPDNHSWCNQVCWDGDQAWWDWQSSCHLLSCKSDVRSKGHCRVLAGQWHFRNLSVVHSFFFRCGKTLRWSMEMKTLWGRCSGSRGASRPFTTHRYALFQIESIFSDWRRNCFQTQVICFTAGEHDGQRNDGRHHWRRWDSGWPGAYYDHGAQGWF